MCPLRKQLLLLNMAREHAVHPWEMWKDVCGWWGGGRGGNSFVTTLMIRWKEETSAL